MNHRPFLKRTCGLAVAVLGAVSINVLAEAAAAAPAPAWTFVTSVALVNDYIWRGQSNIWDKPAVQFSIEADHASGAYAGFWASNVSSQWVPGANLELDAYSGLRGAFPEEMSDFTYDLGAIYVYYPGGNSDGSGFGLPLPMRGCRA
ncbi:MAG TPA: TorF family putative porin [Novimethylophilus sp.]|jgi:uncharacterized protein (TIGR02001 family)|uniref:TorF family putative porin n=1 Tax=Novimethylophilus sp. TaxID=2137426 RepID=UPI002F42C3BE